MDHLEIEVKFYLSDMDYIRDRIVELGAVSMGRVLETNIRFDDADNRLIQKNLSCDSARIQKQVLLLNPSHLLNPINLKY